MLVYRALFFSMEHYEGFVYTERMLKISSVVQWFSTGVVFFTSEDIWQCLEIF